MKDIEKIKSEDLGCQVADANPGNFAIEQEVAQLVGATVPAPTEPSADDARELGAQLLVFLRRALTPIKSALRTTLAAIYANLDSRCTDYTPAAYAPFRLPAGPYDPMRPFVARTLPNLLTAITAFAPRKISNGSATADGIPDGVSLGHLICDPTDVTKVIDDNPAWDTYKSPLQFPNVERVVLNFKGISTSVAFFSNLSKLKYLELPYFESGVPGSRGAVISNNPLLEEVYLPKWTGLFNWYDSYAFYNDPSLRILDIPSFKNVNNSNAGMIFRGLTSLERCRLGKLEQWAWRGESASQGFFADSPNLIDLEVGEGTAISWNIWGWNPTNVLSDADKTATFLQNFRDHIALRLTDQGSGLTLTLSQAVRDAIHAAEATYGIEAIIVTQKGWTLSPAPGASSQ